VELTKLLTCTGFVLCRCALS